MRSILTLVVAGLILAGCTTTPAPKTSTASDGDVRVCKEFGLLGGTLMAARQSGKPKEQARQAILKANDPGLENVALSLVDAAYSQPIFRTEAQKKQAINDFAVETAKICMKARRDSRRK